VQTTIAEAATFDLPDQARHHARDRAQMLARSGAARDRNAAEQALRVGMKGAGEYVFRRSDL